MEGPAVTGADNTKLRVRGTSPEIGDGLRQDRRARAEACRPDATGRCAGKVESRRTRNSASKGGFLLVGTAGFEPATSCSQSRCATRLRHVPLVEV